VSSMGGDTAFYSGHPNKSLKFSCRAASCAPLRHRNSISSAETSDAVYA
jgi:hypothetical protein